MSTANRRVTEVLLATGKVRAAPRTLTVSDRDAEDVIDQDTTARD
jgi:hypothetical protein